MMRKIHRVALAAAFKTAVTTLPLAFAPVPVAWAKALATERRFSWAARCPGGTAYVLLEPSATAADNCFTVDVAWVRDGAVPGPEALGDELTVPLMAPWQTASRAQVLAQPLFRLRLDDLWTQSPAQYRGRFAFSTAASRYTEAVFATASRASTVSPASPEPPAPHPPGESREDRALRLLQTCMAEEKALTDSAALAEVQPAVDLALLALHSAALPAFAEAASLAADPPRA